MVLITMNFNAQLHKEPREAVLSRVPCVGEMVGQYDGEVYTVVDVFHVDHPGLGQPVAIIRVK